MSNYGIYTLSFKFDINLLKLSKIEVSTLGNAIKSARLRRGWSQYELGEKVGIHADTIYLLEKDKGKVHVNYILKLEKVLKCSLKGYDSYYDFSRNTISSIKSIRKSLGMTQGKFAHHIGVCKTTIGKWECGLSHVPRKQYEILKSKGLI